MTDTVTITLPRAAAQALMDMAPDRADLKLYGNGAQLALHDALAKALDERTDQ
jgi:hypothetical protein